MNTVYNVKEFCVHNFSFQKFGSFYSTHWFHGGDEEATLPSKTAGELQHVNICPYGVGPVDSCIGIVQKPVAHPEPSEKRNTNTRSQGKLEGSTIVLRSKLMPAKQSPASSHIQCKPPILTAQGN